MVRSVVLTGLALCALVVLPRAAHAQSSPAQGWRPPSAEMPMMPAAAELQGDLRAGPLGSWLRGVDQVAGVDGASLRASGEGNARGRTRFVRITSGARPVATFSDRNGDGRADMVELYHGSVVVLQVVDANFDGRADAVRYMDEKGNLVREERM